MSDSGLIRNKYTTSYELTQYLRERIHIADTTYKCTKCDSKYNTTSWKINYNPELTLALMMGMINPHTVYLLYADGYDLDKLMRDMRGWEIRIKNICPACGKLDEHKRFFPHKDIKTGKLPKVSFWTRLRRMTNSK